MWVDGVEVDRARSAIGDFIDADPALLNVYSRGIISALIAPTYSRNDKRPA